MSNQIENFQSKILEIYMKESLVDAFIIKDNAFVLLNTSLDAVRLQRQEYICCSVDGEKYIIHKDKIKDISKDTLASHYVLTLHDSIEKENLDNSSLLSMVDKNLIDNLKNVIKNFESQLMSNELSLENTTWSEELTTIDYL